MDLWFSENHTKNAKFSIRVNRQLASVNSDFQRIDVFESKEFGRFLTLDGYMMVTEKDEFIYHEMIVHVPLAVHPRPEKVLVIGAGDGGVVRELARYDSVKHIDLVEIDSEVVRICKEYLPVTACALEDPRVHIFYQDGLKFIRRWEDTYDLIIVDSTDPFGPGEGLFTREFYGNCFKALKEDGIMVNQHESPFYEEDAAAMQRAHKLIVESFPISKVYQAHIPTCLLHTSLQRKQGYHFELYWICFWNGRNRSRGCYAPTYRVEHNPYLYFIYLRRLEQHSFALWTAVHTEIVLSLQTRKDGNHAGGSCTAKI